MEKKIEVNSVEYFTNLDIKYENQCTPFDMRFGTMY